MPRRFVLAPASLAVLSLALAGCGPAVPAHTVDVPPRLVDVRPPRSVAFVHEEVPLDGLRGAIERAIPPVLEGTRKTHLPGLGEVEVEFRFQRRPVALRAEREGLVLEISLVGPLGLTVHDVRCATETAGVTFRAEVQPTLRPGGELAFEHLAWKPTPRGTLRCGIVPVPIGAVLEAATAPLARVLGEGLEKIELPLGPALRAGLEALRPPRSIRLGDKGEACLDLDPGALVLAPVGGEGAAVSLKIGVDVAPRVTLGACPAGASPKSTATADRVLVRTVPLQDHFQVAVAAAVPYAELEARVAPLVAGHRFGEGDRSVTIDALELGDASGQALARVRVHGVVDGDLYLWGTPEVVEEGGRFLLRVPDLRVALESRNVLAKVGLWVWQLVGGGLEGLLRSKLSIDVTDRLAQARAAVSGRRELGHDTGVTLTTALDRIAPGTVTSQPGALVVYGTLVGAAEIGFGAR